MTPTSPIADRRIARSRRPRETGLCPGRPAMRGAGADAPDMRERLNRLNFRGADPVGCDMRRRVARLNVQGACPLPREMRDRLNRLNIRRSGGAA